MKSASLRHTAASYGFTLIEVLISMAVGFALMGFVLVAQQNASELTKRSLALASMHQQSYVLMERIRNDFKNIQPNTAMRISINPADPTEQFCILMTSIPHGARSQGTSGGWDPDQRAHALVWSQWQFTPEKGLCYGATPGEVKGGYFGDGSQNLYNYDTAVSTFNMRETIVSARRPIPVREMRFFDNMGDAQSPSTAVPVAELKPFLWFDQSIGESYTDSRLAIKHPQYELGNNGNLTPDATAHYYGSVLPAPNDGWDLIADIDNDGTPDDVNGDGIPDGAFDTKRAYYTKDKFMLLGVGENESPFYRSRVSRIVDNVELFSMRFVTNAGVDVSTGVTDVEGYHMEAGLYIPKGAGYVPIDPSTSADLSTEIKTVSQKINQARLDVKQRRPKKVYISFVMHDAPEDENKLIIDASAEMDTINYVRSEFYDVSQIPVLERTPELFKLLIEKAGHTAIVIKQVVYLP